MKKRIYLKKSNTKALKINKKRTYPEDNLQMLCASFLDYSNVLWCHVANERLTSKRTGARLKKKGVKSGVPDVLIFEPRGEYIGLAIELKIKPNKPTENQINWLEDLSERGWLTKVCYDFEEFEELVNSYLKT